jgi:16S rRNA processing protein RimM
LNGAEPARPEVLLEVGRIAKAHGLRGDVIIELTSDRTERVGAGAQLWTASRRLTVTASQPHQHRWLVTLDGVTDRTAAEGLAGQVLLAEPLDDPEALWAHEVIGTRVVEVGGAERGVVVAVVANPAHDLLELETGVLVPVVFVQSSADGVTVIDPPDGLFEG